MNFNDYQRLAHKTSATIAAPHMQRYVMAALGIAGESGEVADYVKKVVFHGHPMDKSTLTKELGDVLWYIAEMCTHLAVDLEDVAVMNIEKLRERYPQGFSQERSRNRNLMANIDSYEEKLAAHTNTTIEDIRSGEVLIVDDKHERTKNSYRCPGCNVKEGEKHVLPCSVFYAELKRSQQ